MTTPASVTADRTAAAGRRPAVDKHCVFRVGSSWFSLLATAVREVTMAPDMVRAPGSHAALAGLCHARNEFIPVVQLAPLLGDAADRDAPAGKMLVLSGSAGNWALLIDEVIALESLETLVNPDARPGDIGSTTVIGTATCRSRVVRVLDPNSLYRRAEELLRSCWMSLMQPFDDASTAKRGDS